MEQELDETYWKCRYILQEFNTSKIDKLTYKKNLLTDLLGSVGHGLWIEAPFFCDCGKNIHLGDNAFINFNCVFLDTASITIGHNALIAPNVHLYTSSHPIKATERLISESENALFLTTKVFSKPITIGDNVWIGGNTVVLPGVTIGDNVTIAAGSIITKDIPNNVLVAGNPGQIVKQI